MKVVCFFSMLFFLKTLAQPSTSLKEAERYYSGAEFFKAESLYRKALIKSPESGKIAYNLGNTLYKLKHYKEAETYYIKALSKIKLPLYRAKVYFNLGDTYVKGQEYEKAMDSFQKALRLNPYDDEARYNFTLAKHLFKVTQTVQDQNDESLADDNLSSSANPEVLPSADSKTSQYSDVSGKSFSSKNLSLAREERASEKNRFGDPGGRSAEEISEVPGQSPQGKDQISAAASKEHSVYQNELIKTLEDREKEVQRRIMQRKLKIKAATRKNW